jgi:hypothetical protein
MVMMYFMFAWDGYEMTAFDLADSGVEMIKNWSKASVYESMSSKSISFNIGSMS